jgi:chemotaxis protein MotB
MSLFTPSARFVLLTLAAPALLSACGVSHTKYDALNAQYQQLQQQSAADKQRIADLSAQVSRLQGAIKYTVNSDLLFPSGSWQISPQGQQVMAKIASQLAPYQQNHLVVNGYTDNAPIGPGLKRQGVTSNDILSQKRADAVMQYLISQGVNPQYVSARGWGETQPVAPNDTAQGRQQNRRVEITLGGAVAGATAGSSAPSRCSSESSLPKACCVS